MDIATNEQDVLNTLRIENADLAQWQTVLEWARNEGWDMGIGDADAFFGVDPQGFFVGYLDDQLVAAVSVVNFSSSFCFLGHYLVPPEFRGQGYGLKIFQHALRHGGNRVVGLDGILHQTENYAQSGFVGYRKNHRMAGVVQQDDACPAGVEPVEASDVQDIVEYDTSCTGVSRGALLKNWFLGATRHGFMIRQGGKIQGVIGVRQSQDGYRIGPLLANTPDQVEPLLQAALSVIPRGSQVAMDVPEKEDRTLLHLAEQYGFQSVFQTQRMYVGEPPREQEHQVWCITTLELG
ncbi:GNAT family N-acetyltransferase [Photobacterium galatheae]|uniref:N-acetyltransferase domain-containing protein n=1 Tax=Photobacterium galatheae TaxID=1654360 RepID=A0A066RR15_9GAMM|nr:GNAT family N-acetyltransferase [Photobacterium galatheae]KDM89828.1 hypothetical protein EA58_20470 [Photobacterium galatheae]MCM0151125.1 GNAT family N-acetyltransferase [Photobacterium galatheae]